MRTEEGELEAIEALHGRDMAAARAGDAEALSALWTAIWNVDGRRC